MQLSRPLAVITPTLDGPVLSALAGAEAPFTTGQLHRLLGHGSEEGIRKVLRRLTQQGVVVADRVGVAYGYRLNRDHLAAKYVVALAELRSELLKEVSQALASWFHPPVYGAMFGSAARGNMAVHSDIDILLVRQDRSDETVWGSQIDAFVRSLTSWTGNEVRPLEYTVSELKAARDELADVLREGIPVHGERSWLARQLRQKVG